MINKTKDITIRVNAATDEEFLERATNDEEIPVLFFIGDMICRGKVCFTELEVLAGRNYEVNQFNNY